MRFFLVVALLWSVAYGGVSDTGTYETRVPVSVPAYYGIQPSISLAYSSSGGNGTAGVGWQLNAGSSVRRLSSTHGSPGYDLTDVYYIDGRELLPCSGVASASCSNGGTHAFRTETFQKVVFDSSANTWTVTGREGTQYIYEPKLGTTANSMTTFSWSLARVVDLARHIVTYSYFCDGGSACYPQLISYGDGIGCNAMPDQAPGAPVPGARIQLHWEERTDVITAATGRAFETLRYRLKAIEVKHAGKMIRAYRLRYAPGTTNDSSLLESVEEFGSDAVFTPAGDLVSALVSRQPTRTFASPAMTASMNPVATRTTATNAFDTTTLARTLPRTWPGVSVPLIEHNHVVADVDGDGRVDVTQWHTNSSCTQITLSTRLAGSALDRTTSLLWTSMQPQYGLQPSTCAWYAHRADLDGDGRHDLLFENWGYQSNGAYGLHVVSILSRGGGNWANPSPEQDAQISHSNKVYDARLEPNAASCLVGDYDGDRRDDLACQVDQLQPNISTLLSRGDGTMVQAGGTSMPVTGVGNKVAVIDINGDGRTDIVRVAVKCPAACVWTITTGIATGSGGFQFENQDTVVPGSLSYDEQWRVMAGDIDGDGHGDFAIFLETAVPAQPRGFAVFTGLSRGRGAQRWSFAKVASGDLDGHGGVALADGDGDGADDLMLALLHHGHTASRCGTSISHAHYSFWLGRSLRDGTFAMSANMNAACGVESTIAFITNGHTLGTPRVQHTYAVDTNGDRKADWLSVAPVGNEIDGYVNLITDEPALNGNADPTRWQRADLDGDGREDWVYVGYANPGFQVFARTRSRGALPRGDQGRRLAIV
ncbi:MAG: FG-GAP-like repeat-containing protein [Kofleriaceae bacterium]